MNIFKEIEDRFNHFYKQADGSFKWPNSAEGDILKLVYKLIQEEKRRIAIGASADFSYADFIALKEEDRKAPCYATAVDSPSRDAVAYADYILNHYSRNSLSDKLCLARSLEEHGWSSRITK